MKAGDTGYQVFEETVAEKDLGVHIVNSLKSTYHCEKAANKAMSALKLLRITFDRLTTKNFRIGTIYNVCEASLGQLRASHRSIYERFPDP